MNAPSKPSYPLWIFISVCVLISVTLFSVLFDIPIIRQISGLLFLSFLPGFLIISIIKPNGLDFSENIVLSLGLSLGFTMLIGLLINTIYPPFGYDTPLSPESILITFTVLIFSLNILAYWRGMSGIPFKFESIKFDIRQKTYLIIPAAMPLLSILGMFWMNSTGNNLLILVLLFLIPAYTIFLMVKRAKLSRGTYAPIIYLISISIILLLALRSNYLIGFDVHTEYYIFNQTLANQRWEVLTNGPLDSCLSISILPTAYQSILNINSQYLYKILFPFIFSFSPLVIFFISRKYLHDSLSFLASLFFISQYYFLNAETSPRTVVALLFFGLSLMVLLHQGFKRYERNLFFIIFSISIVVSHYSTAYIYLVVLILVWLLKSLFRRKAKFDEGINFNMVAMVFISVFLWYSTFSGVAFRSAIGFFDKTLSSIPRFLDLASRGSGAIVLGSGITAGDPLQISAFIVSWLTILLIASGIFLFVMRRRLISTGIDAETLPVDFIDRKIDFDFFLLSLIGFVIMVASVILPYVLKGYDLYRVYIQMATMLSTFFVLGGVAIAHVLRKGLWRPVAYSLILLVLVPYFLFNSGAIYQVFGNQHSIVLNNSGQDYDVLYIHEQENWCARWIASNNVENKVVYSDFFGDVRLISQGGILRSFYDFQTIDDHETLAESYFFLRYTGVVGGKLLNDNYNWLNLSDYSYQFSLVNLIYSNGGSNVYR